MRVILLKDVSNLGKKNEIKEVSEGYARNFLLSKNLAILASASAMNELSRKKGAEENRAKKDLKQKKQIAKAINNTVFEIKMKAGERGKLYGSVTSAMISEKLAEAGFVVDSKNIILERPVKKAGEYSVKIDFGDNIAASIKILIVTE
jgi:large subunit ribosomal protein L9